MADARPDVTSYLEMLKAQSGPSVVELDPAFVRTMTRQAAPMVELPAREMPRLDVAITGEGGATVPARVYRPTAAREAAPAIAFFHGGGWVLGDVEGYDPLAAEIAHLSGLTVVSVDYRLAPEHRFPAAVDDCLAAARWTATGPGEFGHPVSGLVLMGDSAGGALAAVVARELLSAGSPVPVLAQCLIYPVTDISRPYPSDSELAEQFNVTEAGKAKFYGYYLGEDFEAMTRHPQVSPLLGEAWRGLPPSVIFTCTLDVLRDQGRAYAAKLASEGVETILLERRQVHGSFTMRKMLPSAQADLERVVAALKLLLG
jgi:acetyl esterase